MPDFSRETADCKQHTRRNRPLSIRHPLSFEVTGGDNTSLPVQNLSSSPSPDLGLPCPAREKARILLEIG